MAFSDSEMLECVCKQVGAETQMDFIFAAAVYGSFRIVAKLDPCTSARETAKFLKETKPQEAK